MLENLFIVLKGRLRIIRTIKISEKESIDLEIDHLEVGNMIGDYCFILKDYLPYSVVSIIPCDLLEVPIEDFKSAVSDNDLEKMISNLRIYPPDSDIKRIFKEKHKWSVYMDDLKKDFESQKKLNEYFYL